MIWNKKTKVGLALSGGATRGIAYLGVFKALEENNIHIDYIAGCSVGALAGAFFASGMKYQEMYDILKNITTKDIVTNKIPLLTSKTDKIVSLINKTIGDIDITELKIPFVAITTNIINGMEMDMDKGRLAPIVAGSCAVPGVFVPVVYEDMHFADGGLTNNFPADVIKAKGVDVCIGIDINSTRCKGTDSLKVLDVLYTSLDILMKASVKEGYKFCDIVIQPNLQKFKKNKLDGMDEMIEEGYIATMQKMDDIKEIIKYGKQRKKYIKNKNKQ